MTKTEVDYRTLRRLGRAERREWIREHAPPKPRGHWWLSMLETAEWAASPDRSSATREYKANVRFAVELIEDAVHDGMPPYYEARALIPVAMEAVCSGLDLTDLPETVTAEGLTQHVLASFRLTRRQALAVAARCRADPDGDRDSESQALGEINWLLSDPQVVPRPSERFAPCRRSRRMAENC
ncbi:MAG: hypothetical protein ACRDT6_00220 [Micromonosporaceae bacterium]